MNGYGIVVGSGIMPTNDQVKRISHGGFLKGCDNVTPFQGRTWANLAEGKDFAFAMGTKATEERGIDLSSCDWLWEELRFPSGEKFMIVRYIAKIGAAHSSPTPKPSGPIKIKSIDGKVLHTVNARSLEGADLCRVNWVCAQLPGASLRGTKFCGATLLNANFKGADLRDADFSDADLKLADFSDADLRGANLRTVRNLNDAMYHSVNYDLSTKWPAGIQPPGIYDIKQKVTKKVLHTVRSVVGREYRLRCANLADAQLDDADLHGADLNSANLMRANLFNAGLTHASLAYCNAEGVNLRDACLHHANLQNAYLHSADLRGASLIEADLSGASFENANLAGATLGGAYVCGTNFRGANLGKASFNDAKYNAATTWPDGFDPAAVFAESIDSVPRRPWWKFW